MVWCNAAIEGYNAQNGTSLECVYYYDSAYNTPIRDSLDDDSHTTEQGGNYTWGVNPNAGEFDYPYVKSDAAGFRLATSNEWALAARYIDDANDDGDIQDGGEYYPGNYASGADAQYDDTIGVIDIDGDGDVDYTANVTVFNTTSTAVAKSLNKNALGL